MEKIYLYPLWLRIWHLINALLMILLFLSGISLHYSETSSLLLSFSTAMVIHNVCGILLSLNYLFYFLFNLISGNYKHYLPKLKNFLKEILIQARYYLIDIFDKEPHPFPAHEKRKFNPLQTLGYLSIMYFMIPLVIVTGWLLMFPELTPDEFFGMGGVWPAAILHIISGFIISIFTVVHVYLGTTGHTVRDLYLGIITGWHHTEEGYDIPDDEKLITLKSRIEKGKILPAIFYNPISLTGSFITFISFTVILFLIILELFSETSNPYLGIFTFMVLPGFLILGIFLIFFGAFRENRILLRDSKRERKLPVLDLNNTKHQVATLVFTVSALLLFVFSGFGSYKAYEYSESDEFCGTVCHTVMEPEYTTYRNSPHSNVGCVQCHIGDGAGWFVKSKISGMYQVYAVLADIEPRPIPTPVVNLRPAAETCERCHSPKHFYDEKKIVRDYYLSNEQNTYFNLEMIVKVGGGNTEIGNNSGIHWHMNLSNEITYMAVDREKQDIPWIKSKSLITGKETVYAIPGFDYDKSLNSGKKLKRMDCIDCHNRPSHIYNPPDKIVNLFLSIGKINPNIPYIKSVSVQALESINSTKEEALTDINRYVWNYYNMKIPNLDKKIKEDINNAIVQLSNIYAKNYFPKMKVNWKNHPDNIGHLYSKGCYRCHDGKHVSPEGNVLTMNCESCHTFKSEVFSKDSAQTFSVINDFVHPGGDDKNIKEQNCVFCHGAPKYRKQLFHSSQVSN
ncbi:MAG: cytochrome b/b6 domain-containing protein [bacterium]